MLKGIFISVLVLASASLSAEIRYVDTQLAQDCTRYDIATRTCLTGSENATNNVDQALKNVKPGDTLVLRAGIYRPIVIQRSGIKSQPITIQGAENEAVIITGHHVGFMIKNQRYVTIKNLRVKQVQGFARLDNATGIIFDNIDFSYAFASGTTGSLKIVSSQYNKVLNSHFSQGSDLLILQDDANFNVIQGNSFATSEHSSISIRCSSQNVLRDNTFNNPRQKAMEIYDCQGISDAPIRYQATKGNLVEQNNFLGTRGSSRSYKYNAIQHCGQQTIVRNNVFTGNLGGGVSYQYYPKECLNVYDNKLYNNTFYNNRCFAIMGSKQSSERYHDNFAINNLLYKNTNCKGEWGQVLISNPESVFLENNSIVEKDPGFVDPLSGDLHLTANSRQIDQGDFITKTRSSGSGTLLPVKDASWFYDGFSIPGELGDRIRIEDRKGTAIILSIDSDTNTLMLSSPLAWGRHDGVHLNYSGNAPDIGAFEFQGNE